MQRKPTAIFGKLVMLAEISAGQERYIKGQFGQVTAQDVHGIPHFMQWRLSLAQPCACLLALPHSDFTRPDGTGERGVPANQSVKRCLALGSFGVFGHTAE